MRPTFLLTYSPFVRYIGLENKQRTEVKMATIPRIGTAGWSYPHWNGLIYPKALPQDCTL